MPDSRAPARVESPRDLVFRDIIRGLYEGRFAPGQRLVEADLTALYGVSRGPVREALSRLAAEGIVDLPPQRGALVRRLSRAEAIDIMQVVSSLMGLAARLAAQAASRPDTADRLEALLSRLGAFDPSNPAPDYATARDRFYGALIELAGNAELRRRIPAVLTHLIRVQFRTETRKADEHRHSDYRAIVDAVLARDPDGAETAMRRHLDTTVAALAAGPADAQTAASGAAVL
jgi:DNA-binding GntR family transcriptional regulator